MSATTAERSGLDQTLLVLRRRWWLIAAMAILVAGCAVGFSLLQQKKYTASASLLFRDTQFDQELFGNNFVPPSNTDPTQAQATNVDLVSLPVIATLTAQALHLSPSLISSELSVSGTGQSTIAKISVTDPNPQRAAEIANTYADQYILFRRQADRSKISAAQQLVQRQLAALGPAKRSSSVGQSLQNRANQLQILAALQTGNAEVVQSAGVPSSPSSPKTKRNGILGGVVGLLLGIALAFGIDRLDRRVRDFAELEEIHGVPVLGTVPISRAYARAGTKLLPPAEAEAFALLRARLRYFNVDHDVRSLLVTSTLSAEGKTTVALNLAIAEALAGNDRVALVEADLRRPALGQRLDLPPGPGLADVLSRNAGLEQASHRLAYMHGGGLGNGSTPSFVVIPAGATPPNPAELLESRAMIDLLTALSERFDLLIIDTPPLSLVSDAIPLIQLVSGTVVVSRLGMTTRDAARTLHQQLTKLQAPVLGVIANGISPRSYGYYHGYSRRDSRPGKPAPRRAAGAEAAKEGSARR